MSYFTSTDNFNDKPLSLESIKKIGEELRKYGNDDPEGAHYTLDCLYIKFIRNIADGVLSTSDIILMAKELATFDEIQFSRWYA